MQRNHSIDAIRGTLLLIMTINHFIWVTVGWLDIQNFTLQPFGQVGAAEGFILISGLMVGLVYSGKETAARSQKLFRRARQLLFYHMAAIGTVLIIAALYVFAEPMTNNFYAELFPWLYSERLTALALSATLLHKPAYFDILPMYVVFLLASPFILTQLSKGRVYWISAISILLWLLSDYVDMATLLSPYFEEGTLNTGYFNWLAWQMLFVTGMILGYLSRHQPVNWFKYRTVTLLVFTAAVALFVMNRGVFAAYGIHYMSLYELADKPLLGWLRVVNLFLLVYLFAWSIQRWPNIFAFQPLAMLGRHSLQVFTWHYVVIFTLAPIALGYFLFHPTMSISLIAVVLLLFVPPILRERNQNQKLNPKERNA